MYSEARKIHLIEEVLKVKNGAILIEIENLLNTYNKTPTKKASILDFVGIISKSEGEEMMAAINETCENIDPNEWK